MGKIKRARVKRHIEAVKSGDKDDTISIPNFLPNESKLPSLFPVNKLFQPPAESTNNSVAITDQSPQDDEQKIDSKKDRRKIRHEKFLKKLHVSQALKEDIVKTKQRQQTVITGDLNPLTLALLDIHNLSSSNKTIKTKKKRIQVKKEGKTSTNSNQKKKQKAQLSDIEKFQQVLAHPAFQSNPLATIEEHVKNVIKNEIKKS